MASRPIEIKSGDHRKQVDCRPMAVSYHAVPGCRQPIPETSARARRCHGEPIPMDSCLLTGYRHATCWGTLRCLVRKARREPAGCSWPDTCDKVHSSGVWHCHGDGKIQYVAICNDVTGVLRVCVLPVLQIPCMADFHSKIALGNGVSRSSLRRSRGFNQQRRQSTL